MQARLLCRYLPFLLTAATGTYPFAGPSQAETKPGNGDFSITGNAVPVPGGSAALPLPGGQTCVQVYIKGQKPNAYSCLNQQLQRQVQGTSATSPSLPVGANSPSNQVGTFNEEGLREQYGQNFGKSVIPYRPPLPVYGNPLHP